MYKHNVIHILYKRMWFVSGFCSLFSQWPAGSVVIVILCELMAMVRVRVGHFGVTFHFQLNYRFFRGSFRVSRVRVQY